jgi:hypothetical protein
MDWIKCEWAVEEDRNGNIIGESANFKLPDDGEDILITVERTDRMGRKSRYVCADVAGLDGGELYLEDYGDWDDDVIAWMPMPEPYQEDNDGQD